MDEFIAENRSHWEEAAMIHPETATYDVEAFLDGETTLSPIEREELAHVEGKRLLHLQCHFGLDTLSWAREGAIVSGLDFAENAIETARALAREAGLADRATFVCGDIYDAPHVLEDQFEVVITTYGVLGWLPDLDRWADAVTEVLEPGGTFYLAEFHPITTTLEFEFDGGRTGFPYPYFTPEKPLTWEDDGTYAAEDAEMEHGTTHHWPHGLGEILSALLSAGLDFQEVSEHTRSPWEQYPGMEADEDGLYQFEDVDIPLLFSVRAVKPR